MQSITQSIIRSIKVFPCNALPARCSSTFVKSNYPCWSRNICNFQTLDFLGFFCMSNLKAAEFPRFSACPISQCWISQIFPISKLPDFLGFFGISNLKTVDLLGFLCMSNLETAEFPRVFLHLQSHNAGFPNFSNLETLDFLWVFLDFLGLCAYPISKGFFCMSNLIIPPIPLLFSSFYSHHYYSYSCSYYPHHCYSYSYPYCSNRRNPILLIPLLLLLLTPLVLSPLLLLVLLLRLQSQSVRFPRGFLHALRHLQTTNDKDNTHKQSMPNTPLHTHKEEKSAHNHHRKKIIWIILPASRNNFRPVVDSKTLSKPRKLYLPPKSFLCDHPSFRQRKVLYWSRVVYGFSFPAHTRTDPRKCLCNGDVCSLFGK